MAHSTTSHNDSIGKAKTSKHNFKAQSQSTTLKHKQYFINELKQYYNLRKPKDVKPTTVFFIVRINSEQVRISTGCKVYPYQWEKDKAKVSKQLPKLESDNNIILNNQIEIYNQRFDEYKYLVNCGQIEMNRESLKHYIYKGQMEKEVKEVLNISQTLKKYIHNDTSFTDATRVNRTREVEKFESFLNGKVLDSYAELNSKLFRAFQEWLIENVEGKNEDGTASPATLNKIVLNLLGSINKYLVANDIISKSQFTDIVVTPIKQTKNDNKIALTEDEIDLLHNYQCETEKDTQIRDLFLLECTTGQRFSDVDKVTRNIIHKDGRTYINLIQDKGKAPIQVDILFELALEIVQKYHYNLPEINNKMLNERIKIIAQKAGIKGSEELFFDHVDKAKAYTITRERHECVCSHTGRNTFVTMLSLRGWHYNQIGRYTGHKKIETIQHYDKSKVGTKHKVMFEALQKERPELLLKLIIDKEELNKEGDKSKPVTKLKQTVKLLDYLFAESTLLKLVRLQESNINIYELKDTKEAISTIKNIERTDNVKSYVATIDKIQLSERINILDAIIWELAKRTCDTVLYQIFQQKVIELGLSDSIEQVIDGDILNELWTQECTNEELERNELDI